MKKILIRVAMIVAACILLIQATLFITGEESSDYLVQGIHVSLLSEVLKEERELIIHLPRNYDSARRYPVMYVLDGGAQDSHMANKVDVLATAGYATETIVVGIPNTSAEDRERNLTPPFMRRDNDDPESKPGEGDLFLAFMESELIPFIEHRYAASEVRLICGNSRGGLLVMYSLIHKPDLFSGRLCFSTPLWRQEGILISRVSDYLASSDSLTATFIYMSAGDEETENIKGGMSKMAGVLKEKAPGGVVHHFEYTPHATHQSNAVISGSRAIARWSEYERTGG